MQKVHFYIGEERHVRLLVHSTNGEPFQIRDATYELQSFDTIEDSGDCIIDDHVIDARIAPKRRNTYLLCFYYRVADERLVEQIEVAVT